MWYHTELSMSLACCSWREFKDCIILSFHGWLPAHTNTAPCGHSYSRQLLVLGRKLPLEQLESL